MNNQELWYKKKIDYLTWQVIRNKKDRAMLIITKNLPWWLTPDLLVYLRIFLTLILLVLFINHASGIFYWLLAIYLFCKITDFIDGSLARLRNLATDFGEIIDPLSDRLLNLVSLGILIYLYHWQSLWLYLVVNILVIFMFFSDYFLSIITSFKFRFKYFRKIFEVAGLLATIILLFVEIL